MDYMYHGHGLMLGEPLLGRRLHDVRRTVQLLRALGATELTLLGRGQGCLLALFAALLDPALRLELCDPPSSCAAWVGERACAWPAANFMTGMLRHFDLPDCYAALGDRLSVVHRRTCGECASL